jgi:two-component system LytT family sensor kinase
VRHFRLPRISAFLQLQIAGWGALYVLLMAAALPNSRQPGIFRYNSLACALLCVASFLIHPICRANMRNAASLPVLALRTFIGSAAAGSAVAFAAELGTYGTSGFQNADWIVAAVQCTLVLFLWCSVYFIVKQWQLSAQERERLLRMEAEVKEAKLSALRYQLNPHFLFNSLNSVSTLYLEEDADAATDMLAQISELLRALLSGDSAPTIPFADEMAFIDKYLAVEKRRLGARLAVEIALAPESMDALVPNMLLQPLVENAVKHGVAQVRGRGFLRLSSWIVAARLHVVVKNSGPVRIADGESGLSEGIGLTNTRARLTALYGSDYAFVVDWPGEGGCEVTIELPCQKASAPGPTCAS